MDELSLREQDKYRRMWAVEGYRKCSPGENVLDNFTSFTRSGVSIGDFGVGCGRAAQALKDKGFHVVGVDITCECLDPGIDIDFIEASLWDLPEDLNVDIGLCTDVMEHIPPEKVMDVFNNIFMCCEIGCYFQIATFKDGFGSRIGETLHLTVQPWVWWQERLEKVWPQVIVLEKGRNARFWVA